MKSSNKVITFLAASILFASTPTISSSNNIYSIRTNSVYVQEKNDFNQLNIIVSGPVLDTILTTFYSVIASKYPEALNPKLIDLKYSTVSHAALNTGVLFRYFPQDFLEKVYGPISRHKKQSALPGLNFSILELPQSIRKEDAPKNLERLCENYRIDGAKSCNIKEFGEYLYFSGQGVMTEIRIPKQHTKEIVDDLKKEFKKIPSYYMGHVTLF